MMAVLSNVVRPTDDVKHTQPNTELFANKTLVGNGTLYISTNCISWIADAEKGLSIPFLNIILHAVCRDTNMFPHECLYLHTDAELPFPNDSDDSDDDGDSTEDGGAPSSTSKITELYLVPQDKTCLSVLYETMAACQALNPDPLEDFSPDEEMYDEVEDPDQQMAELRLTNNENGVEMDGDLFEDAEEDQPDH